MLKSEDYCVARAYLGGDTYRLRAIYNNDKMIKSDLVLGKRIEGTVNIYKTWNGSATMYYLNKCKNVIRT